LPRGRPRHPPTECRTVPLDLMMFLIMLALAVLSFGYVAALEKL
jgi:hypothetical protein